MAKGLEQLLPMHPTGQNTTLSVAFCSLFNGVALALTVTPMMLLVKWVF